ncbi:MAG: ribonuclease HII [Coprobacillus sp.]|nr:ribonuclease HII [Coprobacillus sp.]
MLEGEKKYYSSSVQTIVGTDEAGRGCLAGPVVAAAVILPINFINNDINDSKKLTNKKRRELAEIIKEDALAYSIKRVEAPVIDEINILEASRLAMKEAIESLDIPFDLVLSDAVHVDTIAPCIPLVKGDAICMCIAAASILAKVTRDDIMIGLDEKYPAYDFKSNKGYGTKKHLEALSTFGPIEGVHRYSYSPVALYLGALEKS